MTKSDDTGEDDAPARRKAAREKWLWLEAVNADHHLDSRALAVGLVILQHINGKTGTCSVADETIHDRTGIAVRWIVIARKELQHWGWIGWRRTGNANVYWLTTRRLAIVMERQHNLKKQRDERRETRRETLRVLQPVAERVTQPVAERKADDLQPVADPVLQPVADKLLLVNSEEEKDDALSKDQGLSNWKGSGPGRWRQ